MEEVLVSIWCVTYNHELYIRDAINGFLSQKTDFKYEIVIHDDASTDKTIGIIKEYEQKYPNVVRGIFQTENQTSKNLLDIKWLNRIAIENCRGKYIAICEGDDYWIDNQKLQFQVDYLEMHAECVMATHNAIDMDCRNGDMKPRDLYTEDCVIPIEDIITQKALIPTASTVYRKEVLEMDDFFLNVGIGDYPLLLFAITKGTIYYFKRAMSVYRYCHKGSWTASMLDNYDHYIMHNIRLINFLRIYNDYTYKRYNEFIISKIQRHADTVIVQCEQKMTNNFLKVCKEYNEVSSKAYNTVFRRMERLYLQVFDESYLDVELRVFINKFRRIVIMGAGKYAAIIERQLANHKIDFEGFVVSNNQHCYKNYLGKPIWKFNELPFELKNVGIIIGINPIIWDEIVGILETLGTENYICPFLLG